VSADSQQLGGVHVVVTAGGTREPIDPVRYLGNRSSGKMGNAIAVAALQAGARVTLITAAAPPAANGGMRVIAVETSEEMLAAVLDVVRDARVLVMAAAVADHKPERVSEVKLKKSADGWTLRLVPTQDILTAVGQLPERAALFVVGFAAETDDPVSNAQAKLRQKRLDLIVLNDVSRPGIGMGADDNEVTVIDAAGVVEVIERARKSAVAARLVDLIAERME